MRHLKETNAEKDQFELIEQLQNNGRRARTKYEKKEGESSVSTGKTEKTKTTLL